MNEVEDKKVEAVDVLDEVVYLIGLLKGLRPAQRSELGRRYSIAITELEKVRAFIEVYIVNESL